MEVPSTPERTEPPRADAPRTVARRYGTLAALVLLPACYATDSATSACRQNPAYCALVAGEESGVPLARGGVEIASVAATLHVLSAGTRSHIERALMDCADGAQAEVNRLRLGGSSPTREQCQEVLPGVDPCGRTVTRAMQLGTEKHAWALQCAREHLETLIPGRFSLEQRYRYDAQTGQRQRVGADEARALLRARCREELVAPRWGIIQWSEFQ